MNNNIKDQDENLRITIVRRVLLGIMIIGFIQSIITIFGHKSDLKSLYIILAIIPLSCFGYYYVLKFKSASLVGRIIIYFSVPVLIYRAYHMGGIWGVTTNWIYLLPVFSALFLSLKELLFLLLFTTFLIVSLGYAHTLDPEYSIQQLLLVPAAARVIYLIMPLYVIAYIINFYEKQRKKFIKELEDNAKKQLQDEKLISIGALSAGMAHEINNPLTIISGSISLLKKKMSKSETIESKDIEKYISNLEFGISRISKIILSVKSLSSDSEKLSLEKFKLSEIIQNALILQESEIKLNQVHFSFDLANDVTICGVKIQIEQILMNFIINSIHEIKSQDNSWIKIITSYDDTYIYIRCIDSGLGISSEVENKLFDPFFTSKEVGAGTGLGLSLARKMAKRHDGDIYYELFEGHTSFVLKLKKDISSLESIEL